MLAADQEGRPGDAGITCWDGASALSLAHALNPPAIDCVEADLIGRCRWRAPLDTRGRRLGLTMTTRSAYRHPVARAVVDAIEARIHVSPDLRERLQTALQEAVMNAILHGNLGLDSGLRGSLQGLATMHDMIEARLESAQVARSMICVDVNWSETMLHVVVRDSGKGFKPSELESRGDLPSKGRGGGGQGFVILQAFCDRVTCHLDGTAIAMEFRL